MDKEQAVPRKRRKKVPIVIPNAEALTPEELERAKHNEKQRRQMARLAGKEDPGEFKKTGNEILIMNTNEMIELAKETRNTTLQILNKKLMMLNNDPEQLSKINLATLATAFGIMFDKNQLMDGMATQNINIHQKIDITMSSEDAIKELNKYREGYSEDNK